MTTPDPLTLAARVIAAAEKAPDLCDVTVRFGGKPGAMTGEANGPGSVFTMTAIGAAFALAREVERLHARPTPEDEQAMRERAEACLVIWPAGSAPRLPWECASDVLTLLAAERERVAEATRRIEEALGEAERSCESEIVREAAGLRAALAIVKEVMG